MKKPNSSVQRRRELAHSIEPLEHRIAPAVVNLQAGTGPFTLEVSNATGDLVILNGSSSIVFDQGTAVGDDLMVTGGGAADFFNIIDTAAGHPTFTGLLDVNVGCPVNVNATLTAGQIHIAAPDTLQLRGTISSGSDATFSAAAGITVGPGASISGNADVAFHSDTDQDNDGPIVLGSGSNITANGTANIFLDGNGPAHPAYGDAVSSSGVSLGGTLTSNTGNISIDAHGWDSGAGAQPGIGVDLNGGTIVTNAGSVFITGVGGNGSGGSATGVHLIGAPGTMSSIASSVGAITVNGTGGSGGGSGNYGVFVQTQSHLSAGGGVTVVGTGGSSAGDLNTGVRVSDTNAVISATGGDINITGNGGGVAAFGGGLNEGVDVDTGAQILGLTTGQVVIIGHAGAGTGGNNIGVEMDSNGVIQSGGDITITATEGGGGAPAIKIYQGGGTISTTGTGNIALIGDSMDIHSATLNAGTRDVTLRQFTAGVGINLGAAADPVGGPLGLDVTELAVITAGTVHVGDASSGVLIISAAIAPAATSNFTLTTGGGHDIVFAGGGSLNAAGGNVTISSGGKVAPGTAANEIVANTLAITAVGTIGSAGNPLAFNAVTLMTDTSGTSADQFLKEADTVGVASLLASTGTVTLAGGTFAVATSAATTASTNVTIGGVLDLNGFNIGFNALNGTGTITNNGATPAELQVCQRDGVGVFAGVLQDGASPLAFTVTDQLGVGSETLTGFNSYTGPTTIMNDGLLIAGATNTLPAATVIAFNEGNLAIGSTSQVIAGFDAGTGDILGTGTLTCIGVMMGNFTNIFVKLAGNVGFTKYGIGDALLANSKNSFTGPVTINGGTLQVNSDGALGNAANSVIINDATLVTKGTFTTARAIVANGAAPMVDIVSGTFTINGTVTGTGTLMKTGTGTLFFGSTFTGAATVASGFVTVAATKVGITGTGNVTVTVVSDGMGGTRISKVSLADTDATTILAISGPKAPATTTIDTLESLDPNDEIGTIKLGKTVIVGNGVDDAIPDVNIVGKVDKLLLNDINSYTLFELGKGLPYNNLADDTTPDSYNNHPDIKLRNVLGTGVTIDVTGNGIAGDQPGSLGGGGLGKVVVNSWTQPGTVETSQSIGSFQFKHGDCNVVFLVDPNHLGALTVAGIGKMLVPNGAWGSSGSIVEGNVTVFSAAQFLAAADITAGSMTKLLVRKGPYLGTTTLKNPDAPALGTFSVNGDYQGYVDSAQAMRNINIKGTFKGSLKASSIGSISAYSFDGTVPGATDPVGDPARYNIYVTDGSLGTIKTSAGGIKDFEIAAATLFNGFNINWPTAPSGAVGIDHVTVAAGQIGNIAVNLNAGVADPLSFGIENTVLESASSIGTITSSHAVSDATFAAATTMGNVLIKAALLDSKLLAGTSLGGDGLFDGNETYTRAGKIGNVTVQGLFGTTTIAVGIDPGPGFIYGDGDDVAAPGVATPKALGALVFGAASGSVFGPAGMIHTDAIEAAAIKSLKVGTGPTLKSFLSSHYISTSSEVASDVLVRIV